MHHVIVDVLAFLIRRMRPMNPEMEENEMDGWAGGKIDGERNDLKDLCGMHPCLLNKKKRRRRW